MTADPTLMPCPKTKCDCCGKYKKASDIVSGCSDENGPYVECRDCCSPADLAQRPTVRELTETETTDIANSRMDAKHDHINAELPTDKDAPCDCQPNGGKCSMDIDCQKYEKFRPKKECLTDKDAQEALADFKSVIIANDKHGGIVDGGLKKSTMDAILAALTTPAREAKLLEAFGMFLNGMAYYTTFPDNDEDAKQLSKSATREFMRAERHISEELKSACRDAHKKLITKEFKPQMDKLMEELDAK